jgi:hypothetical protein
MGTTPKTMSTNVGGMERMIRVVAGIAILYFTMAGMIPMPWGLIGIVPILTGSLGWCPIDIPVGINNMKKTLARSV